MFVCFFPLSPSSSLFFSDVVFIHSLHLIEHLVRAEKITMLINKWALATLMQIISVISLSFLALTRFLLRFFFSAVSSYKRNVISHGIACLQNISTEDRKRAPISCPLQCLPLPLFPIDFFSVLLSLPIFVCVLAKRSRLFVHTGSWLAFKNPKLRVQS